MTRPVIRCAVPHCRWPERDVRDAELGSDALWHHALTWHPRPSGEGLDRTFANVLGGAAKELPNEGAADDGRSGLGEAGRQVAAERTGRAGPCSKPRDGANGQDVGPGRSEVAPAAMEGGQGEPPALPAPALRGAA